MSWNVHSHSQIEDDEDAPPPGFGRRFEQPASYAPPGLQAGRGPQQAYYPEQNNWQAPAAADYRSTKQPNSQPTRSAYNAGPPGAAVGAVRQFQRALSSSLADTQAAGPNKPAAGRPSSQASTSPAPDYGDYNDDEDDYGASSSGGRRGRQQPGSGKYPSNRSNSYGSLPGNRSSCGNLSCSSSQGSPPAGHRPQRQATSPGPPGLAAGRADAGAAQYAGSRSAGGSAGSASPGKLPARSPTPDYGGYEDTEEYGSKSQGRGRRRPGAAAAANQALAGIQPPAGRRTKSSRPRLGGGRSRGGGPAGAGGPAAAGGQMSAEVTAQLESELSALRAALLDAEAREVDAQMAVITLETDNSTLQAQLQGMRQQKQQLEMMLLFGDEQQPSGDNQYPYNDGEDESEDEGSGEEDEKAGADRQLELDQQQLQLGGEPRAAQAHTTVEVCAAVDAAAGVADGIAAGETDAAAAAADDLAAPGAAATAILS